LWANPVTVLAEAVRNTFVFSLALAPVASVAMLAVSLAPLALGVWLYSRLRGPIVDVV
jgi:lipopolysaccharide transport system permease protein